VPNQAAWGGPLLIGQYSGGIGEPYQVKGALSEVNIYRRAISVKEAVEKFEASR